MREYRQPSTPLLVTALSCATAALLAVGLEATTLAVAAAGAALVAVTGEFVRMSLPTRRADPALIDRLVEQAQQGRKLAIYDRDTGLFAHWYLSLRGQEECARAARYGHGLGLLIIEPDARSGDDAWRIKSEIGRWIQTELRATDIAGYLGNSRFAVITPEGGPDAVAALVDRLRESIASADVGVSAFPDDGDTFATLWRRAADRLSEDPPLAAAA
jgi:GGDEF domain-containing protein